jgi:dicarboxylate transporter 10
VLIHVVHCDVSSSFYKQLSTTLVTPVDVIKSRIQNARGADATLGIMGTISKSIKADGPTVFFRGWTPAFLRLQPQTTLLFLFFERKSDEQKQNVPR